MTRKRSTHWPVVRRQAYERDRKANAICHHCKQPIDYSLSWPEPYAYEPDHIKPVEDFPELELDLANIAACHSSCNRSRGRGLNKNASNDLGKPSRAW